MTAPAPHSRRRITLRTALKVIRNPLDAIPAEAFTEPLLRLHAAGTERIYLMDPALIHEALVRNDANLVKGRETRRTLGPALGDGLLTAEGAHWRAQRRSAAPVFAPARMDSLAPAMLEAARRTRDRWLALPPGAEVKLGHEMMRTTFDIIVATMLSGGGGLDVARVERAVTTYLAPTGWVLAYSLFQLPQWTPYPGRGAARNAAAYMRGVLLAHVAQRRRGEGEAHDLLALLLAARDPETGAGFSDVEIADNLITFIAAGHETTALGLAWTLHLLERHPHVRDRLLAELDAVVGEGEVELEHLDRLTYTRQVFNEAMRLFPPAPITSREVATAFDLGPVRAPKGAALILPIYAIHRHRRLWDDPERFDPDRFAAEAVRARPRHAFMPFGAGARVCIGSAFAVMEATAVLAVLLRALSLRGDDAAPSPRALMRVTLRPQPDIAMRAEPRGWFPPLTSARATLGSAPSELEARPRPHEF